MNECPFCKRPFPPDDPTITSWTCFLCGNNFPSCVASAVQQINGKPRTLCNDCLEDYLEFLHGEAYLKSYPCAQIHKKHPPSPTK